METLGIVVAVLAGIATYFYVWRNQRNETLDGQVLLQLKQAGSDLSKSHKCELFFVAPTPEIANQLVSALSEIEITAAKTETDEGMEVSVVAELNIVPTYSKMTSLRNRLSLIAADIGAEYDGWGTEVVS